MGIDVKRFAGPLIPQVLCMICKNVFADPVIVSSCEHIFCHHCIDAWLSKSSTCPIDGHSLVKQHLKEPPGLLICILRDLVITCDYSNIGCQKCVKLSDLKNHCADCPFGPTRIVKCDRNCGALFKRQELGGHSCFVYLKTNNAELLIQNQSIKHENLTVKKIAEEQRSIIERLLREAKIEREGFDRFRDMLDLQRTENSLLKDANSKLMAETDGLKRENAKLKECEMFLQGSMDLRVRPAVGASPQKVEKETQWPASDDQTPEEPIVSVEMSGQSSSERPSSSSDNYESTALVVDQDSDQRMESEGSCGQTESVTNDGDIGKPREDKDKTTPSINCTDYSIVFENSAETETETEAEMSSEPEKVEEEYGVYIPFRSKKLKSYNSTIRCRACDQPFPCNLWEANSSPSPQYFLHCVSQCEKYKALGIIAKCDKCKHQFLSKMALAGHKNDCSPNHKKLLFSRKPKWMPNNVFYKAITYSSFNDTTSCRGCQRRFDCYKGRGSKQVFPSLDFIIHCIDQCPAYTDLDLIQECQRCNCKFLNKRSYGHHRKSCTE